jgi:hypothetical protein
VDLQVNLLKLDEIVQHQRIAQTQAVLSEHEQDKRTQVQKDVFERTVVRTEQAGQEGIVREREERRRRGREGRGGAKDEREGCAPPRKHIDITT